MNLPADLPVPGHQRTLDATLVRPPRDVPLRGAVIVVHEIFGLDDHHRDVAGRFAAAGYVALAPNLFTGELAELLTPERVNQAMGVLRNAPPELRKDPTQFRAFAESQPAELRPVLRAFAQVTSPEAQDGFARDLAECLTTLTQQPGVAADRIAAVGFCFGGAVVGRFATLEPRLRAAVIFYGQNPPLDRAPAIRASVLGLYAAEDPGITATVPEFAEALRGAGKHFEHHVYPGAKHAFFNDRRPNYHEASARDAWPRVLDFLAREMR